MSQSSCRVTLVALTSVGTEVIHAHFSPVFPNPEFFKAESVLESKMKEYT